MMEKVQHVFNYDPVTHLLSSKNPAVSYFTKRDLLKESVPSISTIWQLPDIEKKMNKQQSDGSWKFPGKHSVKYPPYHYTLVQTWKELRTLIQQYEMTRKHPGVERACEFLFSCQTKDGDIRGMIGNQYATYYTGAMLGLLIQAGYETDERVIKGLEWLLSMRQDDGGWTIPLLTHKLSLNEQRRLTSEKADPLPPDTSQPFSHNWTDMVLRGFARHPTYKNHEGVRIAADLLKSRLCKPDTYGSYHSAENWFRFEFWWTNLLTSLEILALLDYSKDDPDINKAVTWFIDHQEPSGLWNTNYMKGKVGSKSLEKQQWLTLRIYRVFQQLYSKA